MKKDVFNKKGDFITSVEMSQIFCEVFLDIDYDYLKKKKLMKF